MDRVEAASGRIRTMVLSDSRLIADALERLLSKAGAISIVDEDPDVVVVDRGRLDQAESYPGALRLLLDRDESPFELVRTVFGGPTARRPRPGAERDLLTQREREVLALLRAGMSGADMAASLGISLHTVRSHLQRIRVKLGMPIRGEAMVAARRR